MNKVHISEKMLKFHEMITLRIILTTVKINIKTLSLSLCGVCGVWCVRVRVRVRVRDR